MTYGKLVTQVLDPKQSNLGAVGIALLKAAKGSK
jgi:hypothetical protein